MKLLKTFVSMTFSEVFISSNSIVTEFDQTISSKSNYPNLIKTHKFQLFKLQNEKFFREFQLQLLKESLALCDAEREAFFLISCIYSKGSFFLSLPPIPFFPIMFDKLTTVYYLLVHKKLAFSTISNAHDTTMSFFHPSIKLFG